jgi:riboflavin transporter FmnP
MMNTKNTKQLAIYALCAGIPYLVFGLLEFARGLSEAIEATWEVSTMLVYPDMFSGITLAIVGVIFLFGVWTQHKTNKDTASYLAVGALLASVFFAVYLSILGAHALGAGIYHISSEPYADIFADWAEWTWMDDMRAGIWLYVFALPSVYYTVKMWITRKNKP